MTVLYGLLQALPSSPLFLLHVGGVAIALSLAGYAACNRRYPSVVWFAAWSACTAAWLGATTVGLLVGEVQSRIVVQSVALAVTPLTATALFLFALTYTGRARLLTRFRLRLFAGLAIVLSAFALTNPAHGQVVADITIQHYGGVEVVPSFVPRPGFWIVNGYVYLLFFGGLVMLVGLATTGARVFVDQAVALLLAAGLPLASALLFVSGRSPVPVDLTPVASAVSAGPLAYAVFRSQLLELVPAFRRVGERRAVHALAQGVVVLDPQDHVVVANPAVEPILQIDREAVRGGAFGPMLESSPLEPATRWLDDPGDDDSRARDDPDRTGQVQVPDRLRDVRTGRIYSVTESSIHDAAGAELGRTLVLRDVTEERRRKQRLLVLNRVVRHNLRNDMTVLLGHARMLGDESDDESLEVIETIGSDLIDLGEKAQKIDHIIRETAEDRHPVNVAGIVERVAARHRSEHPEVSFDLRLPEQAWTDAHGPVIEAIVSNLVENAVEHGTQTDGARVVDGGAEPQQCSDVSAAAGSDPSPGAGGDVAPDDTADERPGVTVVLERLSDRLELVVADDGPAIPQHELDSVLEGEVSDLQHASGLGLWTVKWCVDLADADWTVQTDSGTRVVVTFRRSGVEGSA